MRGRAGPGLVPGAVGEIDPRIKRLQIGGTELEADEPNSITSGYPTLWIDSELGMTVGKAAAQVGHASMLLAGAMPVQQAYAWAARGFRCNVAEAGPEHWVQLQRRVAEGSATAVRDAGFTEVAPGSMTVIAVPDN